MLKANIAENTYNIEFDKNNSTSGNIEGNAFSIDIQTVGKNLFHLIKDRKSINAEVICADTSQKTFTIKVNGGVFEICVKDEYDELLEKLGMDQSSTSTIKDIKAPMPGLVLDILVSPGDLIKPNDPLIVLEAMKMENILKSPSEGVIKSIDVAKSDAVEKNQVLINFE